MFVVQVVFGVSLPSALPGIAFGHDGKIKRAVRGVGHKLQPEC